MTARIAKILMTFSLACFAGLVAYDNLVAYDANYEFVRHVLGMDTIFPGNPLASRAITTPGLWAAAYWFIIAGEAATGFLFFGACLGMVVAVKTPAREFNRGKKLFHVAAALGFLIWFFGFMVVGGEWFQMWQSATWNGQESAFHFYMTILGVLIYVNQPDPDLD